MNNHATVGAGIAGSFGIMVTGIQADGRPAISGDALILGNQIFVDAGSDQLKLGSCIEINGGLDDPAAADVDLVIANNICSVTNGATHRGIHLAQSVRGAVIRGNLLHGGSFGPAIAATGVGPAALPRACRVSDNLFTDWVPARSHGATISWWGRDSSIINNRRVGVSSAFLNSRIDGSNLVRGNRVGGGVVAAW
jgi:hypothetical protein